jgi:hypothetical protein
MAEVTYYMVQPFVALDESEELGWPSPIECKDAAGALTVAGAIARTKDHVGAIACSSTHDKETGRHVEKILGRFGKVPHDFPE